MLPATIHRQAHALRQNSKVTARIAEAQAALREASLVSCESLTEALLGVAEEARGDREWSAAVAAYRTLASMHGLMIRKIDVTTRGGEFRVIRHIPEGFPSHEPSSTPGLGPTLDSMPEPPVAPSAPASFTPHARMTRRS